MKASSLNVLKKELSNLEFAQVLNICIRLAKHKKENKELLTYLLFEADDEQTFISDVKKEMDELFLEINKNNMYFIKKSIRKILRNANKHIKYSGLAQTEVELLLYFCYKIKTSGIAVNTSPALNNLYQNQLGKISKAMLSLHDDLQYDYGKKLEPLKSD